MKNNYYRGKFMIGVYNSISEGETLLALCDNTREFASFMQITDNNADVILHNLYYGKTQYIKIDGKFGTVEFIEVDE